LRSEKREHRQGKGGRFARAGLRDTDEIVTRYDRRNGGKLNGSRLSVASILDSLKNL
jgi:hypothetical protein